MCVCVFCFGGREGPGGLRSWVGGGVIEELSFFFSQPTFDTSHQTDSLATDSRLTGVKVSGILFMRVHAHVHVNMHMDMSMCM